MPMIRNCRARALMAVPPDTRVSSFASPRSHGIGFNVVRVERRGQLKPGENLPLLAVAHAARSVHAKVRVVGRGLELTFQPMMRRKACSRLVSSVAIRPGTGPRPETGSVPHNRMFVFIVHSSRG